MVRCPVCDDAEVVRVPSAKVRVSASNDQREVATSPAPRRGAVQEMVAGFPAELVAKLREVVRDTENVGRRFPEEARKIHYEEAPARAIRGQASKEESAELDGRRHRRSRRSPISCCATRTDAVHAG